MTTSKSRTVTAHGIFNNNLNIRKTKEKIRRCPYCDTIIDGTSVQCGRCGAIL